MAATRRAAVSGIMLALTLSATTHKSNSNRGVASMSSAKQAHATSATANNKTTAITYDELKAQDSIVSSLIIEMFKREPSFQKVAKAQTTSILRRDKEDGEKLQQGIQLAIDKGVIPAKINVEPICKIYVTGKSAESVADEIIKKIGPDAANGCIMTLQGLSGTGKGTTVAMLKSKLPNATTWSNGNVFRCLTLLAATYAEQNGLELKDAITPKLLDSYTKMLTFGKFNQKFDVKIDGLGLNMFVSEVCNTALKSPVVGKNIPTVARVTQGEVINFVQCALRTMADDGVSVLLEGREQTLNYIRTPNRFELVLNDENIIGQRRAAQRMGGEAFKRIENERGFISKIFGMKPSSDSIEIKLREVLQEMSKEEE
eukprot:CAMPEP_0197525886 /NCGR_PEP_ID=MMETSP1318-20131121/15062_1 /TAXON_ID=552666 /ORGANISM="Partenskyella glossopodia, Strain RCC365" /LENGTH=371 /DNA_ID=CAMNT_0043079717 /DNA_START=239 /DNA_END=1354 /DNA_ORIENTATION=+